jgi:hypothetical protein
MWKHSFDNKIFDVEKFIIRIPLSLAMLFENALPTKLALKSPKKFVHGIWEIYRTEVLVLRRTCPSLAHLLTNGANSSSEAAHCAATQEIPGILWNPKVHHRVQESPSLVPILSQINQIHAITFYLSKIHFNIVHSPTLDLCQWPNSF